MLERVLPLYGDNVKLDRLHFWIPPRPQQVTPAAPYPLEGPATGSSNASVRVVEMVPQLVKGPPPPRLVLGQGHILTDAEGDTLMETTGLVSLLPGAPALKTTDTPVFGDLPKPTAPKETEEEKGKAEEHNRTPELGVGKGKGLAQEGERYAGQHPNAERAWEKRTNIRRPGERKGLQESESPMHTADSKTDRCRTC